MLHKNLITGDNHFIQQWDVADSAARVALSSAFSSNDYGKVARQLDNSSFYVLQETSAGGQWLPVGGGTGGGGGNLTFSAGTNSRSTGVINFSNSNGVTFGMNTAGVVTASVDTTPGLTGTFAGTDFSGTNISGTVDSNGISLSVSNQTNFSFSNANGVSWSTSDGSIIRASVYQGYVDLGVSTLFAGTLLNLTNLTGTLNSDGLQLSAASQSVDTRKAGTVFAGTNISGTLNTNGLSLSVAPGGGGADGYNILAAGTQTANTTGTVLFSNSNNVSFGMNNSSVITASASFNQTADTNKAGTGFTSTSVAGTNIAGTLNTNGLSLAVPNYITTFQNDLTSGRAGTGFTSAGANIGLSGTLNTNGLSLSATVPAQTAFVFSNSNNVSFGTNGSTVTATATFNQSNQTANLYALGNTTQLSSTAGVDVRSLSFEGAGNITVGVSNGRVLISNAVGGQSVQTQNLHNVTVSGNSTSSGATGYAQISSGTMTLIGGNNITIRQDGNRLELSGPNVGGAQTGISGLSAGTTQVTSGTVVFSNSNGVSFGVNGNTLTASHNGLTTAAQSNHSHGVTLNLTNLSGTTGGNSNGITLSLSAANQSVQPVAVSGSNGSFAYSTLTLGNLNGLSFYTSNGSVVGSYTVPTQSVQTQSTVAVQGSTGNISFSNSNGITFGFNASTITASHNGLTTAALSNHSHGNPVLALTNLSGTTASNSNGLTLSISAAAPGGGGGAAISAGANSQNTGTVSFGNSNGITFGLSNDGVLTASHNGFPTADTTRFAGTGISTSSVVGTQLAGTLSTNGLFISIPNYITTFQNDLTSGRAGTGTTFNGTNISGSMTLNTNGLQLNLSAAAGGGGGAVTVSIDTNTTTAGTLHFDSNYFFLNAGTIFGSVVAAGGAIGAGTQTASTGTVVFSNANNVTFGMSNNSVITASFANAGNGFSNSFWENQPLVGSTATQTFNALNVSTGSIRLFPLHVSAPAVMNSMGFYAINTLVTTSVAASQSVSLYYGIYNSALSLITSNSLTYAVSQSSGSGTIRWNVSGNSGVTTSGTWSATAQANSVYGSVGVRRHLMNLGANTLTNGLYVGAVLLRGSSVGGNAGINFNVYGFPNAPFVSVVDLGDNATAYSTSALSLIKGNNALNGVVTVTSTALPNTFAASQVGQTASQVPYIMMRT